MPVARRTIDQADIDLARRVSPERFLRRHYADVAVNRSGDGISVDKVLRSDFRAGHWISCCWHSSGIGDNVDLVRHVMGDHVKFGACIGEILGRSYDIEQEPPRPTIPRNASNNGRPRVPRCHEAQRGRDYLESRGIEKGTIRQAESQGALTYLSDGVVFLGRDWAADGEIRLAAIRYFEPVLLPNGKYGTKRDLANSDKSFPVILRGDAAMVIVVEGGINSLAAWQKHRIDHGTAPCVVATGGVGMHSWLAENPTARDLVASASSVEIWGENEVDADGNLSSLKQERTDLMRARLQEAIAAIRGGELPEMIYPPPGIKDAAEWLKALPTRDEGLSRPPRM